MRIRFKPKCPSAIAAERSLILSKAMAPQPNHDVHDGARASPGSISSSGRPGEGLERRRGSKRAREATGPAGGGRRALAPHGERCGGRGHHFVSNSARQLWCLPSRAERFRKIIREQFVQMYEENDVPAQVLEQARKDWVRTRKVYLRSRRSMAIWILSRCSEQNTRSPEWRCYSA